MYWRTYHTAAVIRLAEHETPFARRNLWRALGRGFRPERPAFRPLQKYSCAGNRSTLLLYSRVCDTVSLTYRVALFARPGRCVDPSLAPSPVPCAPLWTGTQEGGGNPAGKEADRCQPPMPPTPLHGVTAATTWKYEALLRPRPTADNNLSQPQSCLATPAAPAAGGKRKERGRAVCLFWPHSVRRGDQ